MRAIHRLVPVSLGLCAAVLACRTTLPERAPIPTQPLELTSSEWRVTDQVVVITDASGTQYVNETFPEAKALTRSFVSAMPAADAPSPRRDGYRAGIIGFGGNDRVSTAVAPLDRGCLAATASRIEIMGDINGRGGETPLDQVIWESGRALAEEGGRAALVIFSDGLPDDPELTLRTAQRLAQTRGGELCVHTVQTGDDPAGTEFLTRLAQITPCGSYRSGAQISSGTDVQQLARAVFVGPALPPVAANPCEGLVRLHGIEFEFDQARVTEQSRPVLDAAADQLRRCPGIRVTISGSTDAIGSEAYNQALSVRRAESTRSYLVGSGIGASRLSAQGFGESHPIAPNDTEAGRRENRRVELQPTR